MSACVCACGTKRLWMMKKNERCWGVWLRVCVHVVGEGMGRRQRVCIVEKREKKKALS